MALFGPLLRSIGSRASGGDRQQGASERLGCLESVGPCGITGWVWSPRQRIREVVLQAGPHQLARARPSLLRPDVAGVHGGDGLAGFALTIDDQLPLVVFEDRPAVVVINDRGRAIGELLLAQEVEPSERSLRAALDPRHRGLRGHWDGFDPQTGDLVGWAHRGRRGSASVWLQRAGAAPQRIACNLPRTDIPANGQPRACGFRIAWPLPQEPPGSPPPQLSLDREGLLPLPAPG